MELNEYQKRAMETCLPSCENFTHMMLNLVGEVGEFAGKVAKAIRKEAFEIDNGNIISGNKCNKEQVVDYFKDLKSEAGDIAWQLVGLCEVMGWDFEDVCQANLDKLAKRKAENTIITHQDH